MPSSSWRLTPAQLDACLQTTSDILKPRAAALFLDYMAPRQVNAFVQSIDARWVSVEEVFFLGDRLYYTIERVARDLRLPLRRLLASEGVARGLRAFSNLGGRRGSKHICVIARAR